MGRTYSENECREINKDNMQNRRRLSIEKNIKEAFSVKRELKTAYCM